MTIYLILKILKNISQFLFQDKGNNYICNSKDPGKYVNSYFRTKKITIYVILMILKIMSISISRQRKYLYMQFWRS